MSKHADGGEGRVLPTRRGLRNMSEHLTRSETRHISSVSHADDRCRGRSAGLAHGGAWASPAKPGRHTVLPDVAPLDKDPSSTGPSASPGGEVGHEDTQTKPT